MTIKNSKILDGYRLMLVYPDDQEYNVLRPLFSVYGLALTDTHSDIVYVDGGTFDQHNYDNSHLEAIDAHEMAHIILGHGQKEQSDMEEIEADYFAILMLNAFNYTEAAEILIDDFQPRHGILYEEAEERIDPDTIDLIMRFMGKNFPDQDVMNEENRIVNEFIELQFKAFKNCEDNIEFLANDIKSFDEKIKEVE